MVSHNWRRHCTGRSEGPLRIMLQSIQAALLAIFDAPMRIMRNRLRRAALPPPPRSNMHRRSRSEPYSPEFLNPLPSFEAPKDR